MLAYLRRGAAIAPVAVLLSLIAPAAPAQAHPAGVQPAVDFRVRVGVIEPALPGVRARYIDDGSRLELRNDSGRTVDVVGYQNEPMYRLRPDGLWKNTRAPSLYVDSLGVPIASGADAHAVPEWQHVSPLPIARWQDHRMLWHGSLPAAVQADPSHEHRLADWRVPLREADGTVPVAQITGTLDWVPPPAPGSWWAVALLVAAVVAGLGLARPAGGGRAALGVRLGLAGTAFAAGAAAVAYPLLVIARNAEPRAGSYAVALVSQALPVLIGLLLVAGGAAVLARRVTGDFVVAFAGVCVVAFAGLGNVGVFAHAVAPIAADGRWARLAEVAVLGGGAGLAVAGVARMRQAFRAIGPPLATPEEIDDEEIDA